LSIGKELFGSEDLRSVATYNNIGLIYYKRGNYSEGFKLLQLKL